MPVGPPWIDLEIAAGLKRQLIAWKLSSTENVRSSRRRTLFWSAIIGMTG
jgi:hypothetical protein